MTVPEENSEDVEEAQTSQPETRKVEMNNNNNYKVILIYDTHFLQYSIVIRIVLTECRLKLILIMCSRKIV